MSSTSGQSANKPASMNARLAVLVWSRVVSRIGFIPAVYHLKEAIVQVNVSDRGFVYITHPAYNPKPGEDAEPRLCSESSVIGDYEDSMDKPGSSFLWFGRDHHLNREQVAELRELLTRWLETGRLR